MNVFLFPRASERRVLPIAGVCISSSHLHTFSSSHLLSHLLIFTSAHLHNLLILTSSHLLIFSSSHLLIFTSAHLHIFLSSHLLIFTSSHLHIFSSSHPLLFTSSHLHILTSSLSLSRTHIFTYSDLLSLSPLSSLLSLSPFSLPFLSLAFFIFLSLGRGWCRRGVPFARNEVRSSKTEVKLCFYLCRSNLSHEMRVDAQKLR